jgi:hypothetical protein
MHAEDLVFWIDRLPDPLEEGAAVLCRRHADSMVVPRGWTLDDLRDPDLHLFRPPLPAPTARTRATRPPRPPRERAVGEQLRLDPEPAVDDTASESESESETEIEIEADTPGGSTTEPDPDVGPWTPSFDEADDLDGLLSARGPLLSRAFRTADRPAE